MGSSSRLAFRLKGLEELILRADLLDRFDSILNARLVCARCCSCDVDGGVPSLKSREVDAWSGDRRPPSKEKSFGLPITRGN